MKEEREIMDSGEILSLVGIQNQNEVLHAFQLLISLGLKLLGADEGSLLVFRKKERDLQFAATVGNKANELLVGKTVPLGKGITGMAAMTGEIQSSSRAAGGNFYSVQDDGTPNSIIAAPIMLDDELIGVITAVSFDKGKVFSSTDCQNFSILSELGAVIITQEQQIANCTKKTMRHLTRQSTLEMQAAQKAIHWLQKNPGKADTVLEVLSLLSELK